MRVGQLIADYVAAQGGSSSTQRRNATMLLSMCATSNLEERPHMLKNGPVSSNVGIVFRRDRTEGQVQAQR
jgi:hypothetical protein